MKQRRPNLFLLYGGAIALIGMVAAVVAGVAFVLLTIWNGLTQVFPA